MVDKNSSVNYNIVNGVEEEKRAFISSRGGARQDRELGTANTKSVSATVDDASWLSFISFAWMFPWMWRAYKGKVSTDPGNVALWRCSVFDSANVNLKRLEHIFNEEKKQSASIGRAPSLLRAVFRFMRFRLALACAVFLFCLVFGFIGPTCLVRGLIAFTEQPPRYLDGSISYATGLYLAAAIFVVEILRVLAYGATWAISYRTAIRTRGAVLALLYKTLLGAKSVHNKPSAEVVNMFANEGQRIFDAVTFAPLVIIGPFVLVGGLIYLLRVVGPWSLLGVAVFFIFDIIQAVFGVTLLKYRRLTIEETEKRLGLVGEIINCIKCIKLNAWEMLFYRRVCAIRNREKHFLRNAGYIQSLMIAAGAIVPSIATIVMVLAIVLSGSDLKASDAFSAITVFFVMLFGIRMIPYGMRYLSEAVQSLTKINKLLLVEQYDAEFCAPKPANLSILVKGCRFTWGSETTKEEEEQEEGNVTTKKIENGKLPKDDETAKLNDASDEQTLVVAAFKEKNVDGTEEQTQESDARKCDEGQKSTNAPSPFALQIEELKVQKGELVGICGVVGAGKTALFNAITGHMFCENNGTICVAGTVALCAQNPSILPLSIRENILFGQQQPMNSQRYYKAISCAQLQKDLEQFPDNELSKVTACKLSGGQRSRISIARAFYSNRDIYLFDEIFASIDKPVAQKIFANGIKELLSAKTRLFITDDAEFLAQCDRVVLVEAGKLRVIDASSIPMQKSAKLGSGDSVERHLPITSSSLPYKISKTNGLGNTQQQEEEEEEEALGLKPVSKENYLEYIRAAGGNTICALVVVAFLLNVGSNIFATFWLAEWMRGVNNDGGGGRGREVNDDGVEKNVTKGNSLADPETGLEFYALVYVGNVAFLFLSGVLKAIVFVKFTLNASTQLHNRMLKRVLFAVMPFFHCTSTGRILNRFSKDMDEIDSKLPFSAEALLQGGITCAGFLLMIIWVFPLFLIPSVPLFLLFLLFFICFRAGIRSLKRVENVTRSPLYEHITSSLDALPTLHAYGQSEKFIEQLKCRLDENTGALFLYHAAMRWQAVWLDLLVVLITFTVSLFSVLLTGRISPSEAGMAIAFAMQMSGIFQFAVRSQTELEAKLTAVERISHYYKTIQIEPEEEEKCERGEEWPINGNVEFDNVVLRYRPNGAPALNGVSFCVNAGEKIGIVGRTGSGKTSICNALFRLYPLESGKILIGSDDATSVSIRQLRRSITIISQEATLFAGTIRFNIDPEGECGGDNQIWECLNKANVSESLKTFPGRLDFVVEQNGRNLSAGQKQLVCLMRALLRKTKIVVLDEATANIDTKTDLFLQQQLRDVFADKTLLLITHRLGNSVSGLHRVLQMDDGRVSSFKAIRSTPSPPLQEPNESAHQL